jgi:hypothetical protein
VDRPECCYLSSVYSVTTDANRPTAFKKNFAVFLSFVPSPMPRILFVSGFHPATRARDLAFEFERYALSPFFLETLDKRNTLRFGPLIRCDVPAPRNPSAHSNPYVLFALCFFLLSRCSATSALFAARSPIVSARTRLHASF